MFTMAKNEFIVYKLDLLKKSGKYHILPLDEAFRQIQSGKKDLPKVKITDEEMNIPEMKNRMIDSAILWLKNSSNEEWIITKII